MKKILHHLNSRLRHAIARGAAARGIMLALFMSWSLCSPNLIHGAESQAALEYKVKGGYIFNFAKFIEWPEKAQSSSSKSFLIGVIDAGEALPVLQQLLAGKTINGRSVEVRAVSVDAIPSDLHILLVTKASGRNPEEVRTSLGNAATLLVGETEQFAERGGIVGFVREDENIRVTLNLERAAEAGLKISSKLASVARVVKGRASK